MATRIEKQYKTNSLKLINDILNLVKEYAETTIRMSKSEGELCKSIIRTIEYFLIKTIFRTKNLQTR